MLTIVELLASQAPSTSVRSLVRTTNGNAAEQRATVVDGVRRAWCLTSDGLIYAKRSLLPYITEEYQRWSKSKQQALADSLQREKIAREKALAAASASHLTRHFTRAMKETRETPTASTATSATSSSSDNTGSSSSGGNDFISNFFNSSNKSKQTAEELLDSLSPADYYVEVASERRVLQSFFPNRMFSGVSIAVSDVFYADGFHTRGGLESTLLHREDGEEFPLLTWLRKEGGTVVGKLKCQTPLTLHEGCEFGPQKPIAAALRSGSAHYVLTASLTSPAALTACVSHDLVGFKPTSQTIGTFSKPFRLTIPSASIGVAAARVDDLLFLWQSYTATLDAEYASAAQKSKQQSSSSSSSKKETSTDKEGKGETPSASSSSSPRKETESNDKTGAEGNPVAHSSSSTTTTDGAPAAPEGLSSGTATGSQPTLEGTKDSAGLQTVDAPHTGATSVVGEKKNVVRSQHSAYVAARDRGSDAAVNSSKAILADIDVGWKDYNAIGMGADDFHLMTNRTRRRRWMPSFLRRMMRVNTVEEELLRIPRIELAIGYPAEWINAHCTEMYGTAKDFHQQLLEAAVRRSAISKAQKIEIIPITFDFRLEDVQWSCEVIAQYELVRAMEAMYDQYSKRVPLPANKLQSIEAFIKELPPALVEALRKGQQLPAAMYDNAWRVRDDVIRSTEEQFQDVDAFVLPLLARPYTSGSPSSNLLTLPFHLAGHPMLSLQLEGKKPVALVGELGRDAALLEDALRFVQFVRGDAPSWWRRKIFGASSQAGTPVSPEEAAAASASASSDGDKGKETSPTSGSAEDGKGNTTKPTSSEGTANTSSSPPPSSSTASDTKEKESGR